MKTGLLLLNVGTPDDPNPPAVGRYLKEFLMDRFVVDVPWLPRWLLVNSLVPRRKIESSKLYQKVWTAEGSPLLVYSRRLLPKVASAMGDKYEVRLAMRYGNPSMAAALKEFAELKIRRLVVFPLYPQYSAASSESARARTMEIIRKQGYSFEVTFLKPFYDHPAYLDAVAQVSQPHTRRYISDLVIFSFHGLPERQIRKADPTKTHCLVDPKCCDVEVGANKNCYRHQCYLTAQEIAKRLNINPLRYAVAFQSRLGRTPWIQPFTDEFYRTLPGRGIKRLLVMSPSFVTDCLETVEEIQIRGKEEFLRSGGSELYLVPSLNDSPQWVEAAAQLVREHVSKNSIALPTKDVSKH